MIVRKEKDDTLALIGQTDHSRFAGQLAAHWGNADFAAPAPYESVVRAATFHDYGWLRYETAPLLDAESGTPFSFLQVPLTPAQMGSYQWALDWMADIDPYAGLIVSMHRTGLWKSRYQTIEHPMGYNLRSPSKEIAEFIERNEAKQKALRAKVDDGNFDTNYRLMQVWDLLALYFCHEPAEDHVSPVPTAYGNGSKDVDMTLTPLGPRKVKFDPFPFDARPCRVQLTCKKLPKAKFADSDEFRKAYFQAPTQMMEFELVS
jgi:uncharacterized protein DUF3891